MAKINVVGEAVVVTSAMSLSDLKTIEKYRPKALTLYGGEDGKEPMFMICTSEGAGGINKNGVVFNAETHDEEKKACLTMICKGVTGDVKEWVADKIGSAIISLNKLEESLPDVIEEINDEKEAVLSNITISA